MPIESASFPAGLDPATYGPESTGANSDPTEGALYIKNIREILINTFANVSGAITSSHTELNYNDLTTLGTAELSKVMTVDASGNCNAAAVTWTNLGTVTTVDINGGTISGVDIAATDIDSSPIGASTPSTGAFTTLTASGNITFTAGTINGIPIGATTPATGAFSTLAGTAVTASTSFNVGATIAVVGTIDDDTMATATNTTLATSESIKAYVDGKTTPICLNHTIADVSTAEILYIPVTQTGTLSRVDLVLGGAISVANPTVTVKTLADAAISSIVIGRVGSAAGDAYVDTSLTNNTVTAGDVLKIATDGASTGAAPVQVALTIDVDLT